MNKSANNENSVFEQMFENTAIMTVKDNNDVVWFKAKDVCTILGYKKPRDAVSYNVNKEDKIQWKALKTKSQKFWPLKMHAQTAFINESGVNALVMKSKKPNAKKFQHWVTSEVIPQLRKHGFYVHKEHKPSALPHEDGYAYFSDKSIVNDEMREKFLNQPNVFKDRVDIRDKDEIMKVMNRNDDICFHDYENETVMYLYMTSIKNVNDNRLICKVGFTTDLMKRHIQLMDADYKAHFYIIGVKRCNRISDETRFHRMFKKYYNKLNYKCKIKSKEKDELYYYDTTLIKFWDKFKIPAPECENCEGHKVVCDILKEENQDHEHQIWLLQQKNALLEDTLLFMKEKEAFYKKCSKIDKYI